MKHQRIRYRPVFIIEEFIYGQIEDGVVAIVEKNLNIGPRDFFADHAREYAMNAAGAVYVEQDISSADYVFKIIIVSVVAAACPRCWT